MSETQSVLSNQSIPVSMPSHAEKNLVKIDQSKTKEIERLQKELEDSNEEL